MGVFFWGVVGAGSGVDAGCEPTGTSALPGVALPVAVRLGRCFWGWCWLGWRGGGIGRWWGNCGGVFLGVVGAGSGVDAGCEPTGTSALPGSALPGSALLGAVRLGLCFLGVALAGVAAWWDWEVVG
ncbi:MAG: hypothetical protein ACOX52_12965, partial [Verrucomicrobiota bacterium]